MAGLFTDGHNCVHVCIPVHPAFGRVTGSLPEVFVQAGLNHWKAGQ